MQASSRSNLTGRMIRTAIFMLAGYIINYLLNVFLARHMSSELYGDYALAYRALFVAGSMVLLGTDDAVFRFFSKYHNENDGVKAAAYLRWNLRFVAKTIAIFFVIILVAVLLIWLLDYFHIKSMQSYHLAIYALIFTPLAAIAVFLYNTLVAAGRSSLSTFIYKLVLPILIIVFFIIGVEYLNIPPKNPLIIIVLFLVLLMLVLAQVCIFYLTSTGQLYAGLKSTTHSFKNRVSIWKRVSLKIYGSSIFIILNSVLGLLIVELVLPGEGGVGHFSAILVISTLLLLIPSAIYQPVHVKISGFRSSAEKERLFKRALLKTNLLYFLLSLTVSALLIVFSKWLLAHFGKEYIAFYVALIVNIIAVFFAATGTSPSILLKSGGYEKFALYINIVRFFIFIVLGVILTIYFGVLGICCANLAANLIKWVASVLAVRLTMKIKSLVII
jgi:O-antigen/teichoic acid export membrane protein